MVKLVRIKMDFMHKSMGAIQARRRIDKLQFYASLNTLFRHFRDEIQAIPEKEMKDFISEDTFLSECDSHVKQYLALFKILQKCDYIREENYEKFKIK